MTAADPAAAAAADLARLALRCLDLTSLRDDDSDATIEALAARAVTPHGAPAALCVYPAFVPAARQGLDGRDLAGVNVATVVNFPLGLDGPEAVADQIEAALAAGADEIDAVLPWQALKAGDKALVVEMLRQCREACGETPLKVILETGELETPALIRQASELALAGGADFLKTSTGKVRVNATPAAVAEMLTALRGSGGSCGIKIAGGVATMADVAVYVALVRDALGEAALSPARLRFGASSLLPVLLDAIEGREAATAPSGY